MGCLFSIDSDAHAPGQLDFLSYGCARAEELGLEPDRIVTPGRPTSCWSGPGRDVTGRDTCRCGCSRLSAARATFSSMQSDLPPGVEVRRSKRRKRTVSAYRRDGKVIVMIPDRFTRAEEAEWVTTMLDRLAKSEKRRRRTDDQLMARADELCRDYLHGKVEADVSALGGQHDDTLGLVHHPRRV